MVKIELDKELKEFKNKMDKLKEYEEFQKFKKYKSMPKIEVPKPMNVPKPKKTETINKVNYIDENTISHNNTEYIPKKTCAQEVVNILNKQRFLLIGAIVTPFVLLISYMFNQYLAYGIVFIVVLVCWLNCLFV